MNRTIKTAAKAAAITGIALIATVFFSVSTRIFDILLGTISLIFIRGAAATPAE